MINWAQTTRLAAAEMVRLDAGISVDITVRDLSKAQQQLVQIARAVATKADILIFDEQIAALTNREAERLFTFIRAFRAEGGSAFYISHRLDEILALSDRISVMRDGAMVAELELCVAMGDFVAVGDDDGWIILPPRRFIQPEQWALLDINAQEEKAGALHTEGPQETREHLQ